MQSMLLKKQMIMKLEFSFDGSSSGHPWASIVGWFDLGKLKQVAVLQDVKLIAVETIACGRLRKVTIESCK